MARVGQLLLFFRSAIGYLLFISTFPRWRNAERQCGGSSQRVPLASETLWWGPGWVRRRNVCHCVDVPRSCSTRSVGQTRQCAPTPRKDVSAVVPRDDGVTRVRQRGAASDARGCGRRRGPPKRRPAARRADALTDRPGGRAQAIAISDDTRPIQQCVPGRALCKPRGTRNVAAQPPTRGGERRLPRASAGEWRPHHQRAARRRRRHVSYSRGRRGVGGAG